MRRSRFLLLPLLFVACANPEPETIDSGVTVTDAGEVLDADAGIEVDTGVIRDAGTREDAGLDVDGGPDSGPGPVDGGPDSGPGVDGGPDSGPGPVDGGPDGGADVGPGPSDVGPGPTVSTWVPAGSSGPRLRHTASLLPDGRVLLVGGQTADEGAATALASVEIFDPSNNSYTAAASLPGPRFQHQALTLPDGRVLVTGGTNDTGSAYSDAIAFDPTTGIWSAPYPFTRGRRGYGQTLLGDGTVLITAGYQVSAFTGQTTELFDPMTNTFTALTTLNLVERRAQHASFTLDDGRVLIVGGSGGTSQPSQRNTAEIYDPAAMSGTFTVLTSTMTTPRGWPFATKLADGRILVTGQLTMSISDVEVFDPVTNTFVAVGPMTRGRLYHAITPFTTGPYAGRALVSGGRSSGRAIAFCDEFDPTTDTFVATDAMDTARTLHTATELMDGRVFVYGGVSGQGPVSTGEIFIPVN